MTATKSPYNWTGHELAQTRAHLITLRPDYLVSLARELPSFEGELSGNADDRNFRAEAQRLLGGLATQIIDRTQAGPGVAVIVGAGLEDLSDDQLYAMLYCISITLGTPMVQNRLGERIISVRDEGTADSRARGYRTNSALLMHTDAADVAGLICLSEAASGGSSIFASAEIVHDLLADEAPHLLHEFYRLWKWDLRGEQRAGISLLSSPIFISYRGKLFCRYASRLLRSASENGGPPLTAEQIEALDRFEQISHRAGIQVKHSLRRGESIWINNYAVLHGRESFSCEAYGSVKARHLLRVWLWLHEGPAIPSSFASPRELY